MGEKERGIRDNCIKVNELWFQIKMIRVLFYKFLDSLLAILNTRDYQAETLFSAELSVLLLIGIECG